MKKSILSVLLILLVALFACDSSSKSDEKPSDEVTIPQQLNELAEGYDNFPSDAEVVSTDMSVNGQDLSGDEASDTGKAETSTIDTTVTIPASLSRAFPSDLTIQLWINGKYIDIAFDGTSAQVSVTIDLEAGSNVFCFVFSSSGKTYRSPVIHIYYCTVDPLLIGKWIKTGRRFLIDGKIEGFEFTSDGTLYNLVLNVSSKQWEQSDIIADNVIAIDGKFTSFNPDHPTAELFVSTYTLSNDNLNVTITEEASEIYGVKIDL